MGNLLSAISGQFAKAITLGTLFPVIITTVLNILFVAPLLPAAARFQGILAKIAIGDEKWSAVTLTFIVLVATGLLYNLNIPIIRLFEGYTWKDSTLGAWLTIVKKRRFARIEGLLSTMEQLRTKLQDYAPDHLVVQRLDGEESSLERILNFDWPDRQDLVLPTHLGNVIRSFERYPSRAYGIEAIAVWPRLVSKIDSAFASTIDEAKTSFDFMLNMTFLSALTAGSVITICLARPRVLSWCLFSPFIWTGALFLFLAAVFYAFAVNRAAAWGDQIRAAFDLYRLDLLKQLGYQQKPLTYQEERNLWLGISDQLIYADDITDPVPFEQSPTRLIASPSDVDTQNWRKVGSQEPNLHIPVSIGVTNNDANRPITVLRIIDLIPDGYKYVPDSLSVDPVTDPPRDIAVARFAPLEILVGPIEPGVEIRVTYALKPVNP